MNNNDGYTDAPPEIQAEMDAAVPVDAQEFLSSLRVSAPDVLANKKKLKRVTIQLSEYSVERFKHYADKKGIGYQGMIRGVLDEYADKLVQ